MVQMGKERAIEMLQKALEKISELKKLPSTSPRFKIWHGDTQLAIAHAFGSESRRVTDFDNILYFPRTIIPNMQTSEFQAAHVEGLETAAFMLESMIGEIDNIWSDDRQSPCVVAENAEALNDAKKVFVVHGHDEAVRETVARFLEHLCLKPIILHEQPNSGRTVIEKFEDSADVAFAVVLLTPDDTGMLNDGTAELKPRARQNVVFELGYFFGKLGRQRVCALVKGAIEKPSDYDGVVYVPLDDNGGWKLKLVRELTEAGFDVDANAVLQQ